MSFRNWIYVIGLISWHTTVGYSQSLMYPVEKISNEELELRVYLPDADHGYYRGSRFDWSGVIGSLSYRGHEYFGQWVDEHDPLLHEAITGPVEAFTPIGYEQAGVNETFLIIGVGTLLKSTSKPYHFATPYQIMSTGEWKINWKKNWMQFTQSLQTDEGISYEYIKTISLEEGKAKMHVDHQLINRGSTTISTSVYNHNFFVIDQETTGPAIRTKFPFDIQAEGRGFGEIIEASNRQLRFLRTLKKGESVYTPDIHGYSEDPTDYHITIENQHSGAGVIITADRPLTKLSYWACHSTACPEPYIDINTQPGETFHWTISYEFYEL